MSSRKEIVILGAGHIGLMTAYYLLEAGHQVSLVDKASESHESGCSYVNAGLIVPSHFVPLAAPGVISQGFKWLLDKSSPFYIKPRFNLDLLYWIYKFYKASNKQRVKQAAPVLYALNKLSRDLYVQLNDRFKFDLKTDGLLMMYKNKDIQEHEIAIAKVAKELGLNVTELTADQVNDLNPHCQLDVRGAIHYHDDAHLNPRLLNDKIKSYLKERGVTFINDCEIRQLVFSDNKLKALVSDKDKSISGQEFVICGGAWSSDLASQCGIRMPIEAGKGYSLTLDKPQQQMSLPGIMVDARLAVTPMQESLRFAGTMEIAGFDSSISEHRVKGIKDSIPCFLPQISSSDLDKVQAQSGLRPCSPDGFPYIGKISDKSNVIVATGHSMMGLSLAPITALLVTEMIDEKDCTFSSDLFSVQCFS